VGGGNSAGQAAVFLAAQVSRVYVVIRGDDLNKTMSRYLVDQINRHPRVTVRSCTEIRQVHGNGALTAVLTRTNEQASGTRSRPAPCSSSSAPIPTPHGSPAPSSSTTTACAYRPGCALLGHRRQSGANATSADDARDQPTRRVRGGRRAQRLGQAGGVRVGEGSMAIRQIHEYFGT